VRPPPYILSLLSRPSTFLFFLLLLNVTRSSGFLSCLIYMRRRGLHDRAAPEMAGDPGAGFHGSISEFNVHLSESVGWPRIQISSCAHSARPPLPPPRADPAVRRARARSAPGSRRAALGRRLGRRAMIEAVRRRPRYQLELRRFGGAFPPGYREEFAARAAGVPDAK